MRQIYDNPVFKVDITSLEEELEQLSVDCGSSTASRDGLSSLEASSLSFWDVRSDVGRSLVQDEEEDGTSSTMSADGISSWLPTLSKCIQTDPIQTPITEFVPKPSRDVRQISELSEIDMMKERFSKLLLGEDMSGGAKGVASALALSNAITNLSVSVFGELWRLKPLSEERKSLWRREMEWLLSVAEYIVELVPSWHTLPDGRRFEVMVNRQRSDLHLNLPALRKLDLMLVETLDGFVDTEFWYIDQGNLMADDSNQNLQVCLHRHEEKWWLPTLKVPVNGLSEVCKKQLQHQRECLNQILKATVAINTQVLAEMEIPDVYWDALPKNAKSSLGEVLYRHITAESFAVEPLLCMLDLSSEHKALDLANRMEAAVYVWRRRQHFKSTSRSQRDKQNAKNPWGLKEAAFDIGKRGLFASRAESVLAGLRHRFPSLRQSFLDTTKIQHNRDVGQSILESYSRVLESLAFNISSRIEDVLQADDLAQSSWPTMLPAVKTRIDPQIWGHMLSPVHTHSVTSFTTPSASPTLSPSPRRTPNSPYQPGCDVPSMLECTGYAFEHVSVKGADFR